MKSYSNYDLYRHNTMHLHCKASEVYVPENVEDIKELVLKFKKEPISFRILGAGSNIVLPARIKTPVIILSDINKRIAIENDLVECGSSVRIQKLIREAQKHGLGGLEYLFSVPCSVGGVIVMNAGHGNGIQSIGNYVEEVRCLNIENGTIEIIMKGNCCFGFRRSVFLHSKWIVLSTLLRLEQKSQGEIEELINQRKQFALEKLDDRRPSCGRIFNQCDIRIMQRLKGLRIGDAEWSKKNK